MSNGVNFTDFPLWENMNFTRNCSYYGNWLSTFVQDNSWQKNETLRGSTLLIIEYFISALPNNNTLDRHNIFSIDNETVGVGNYFGKILEWYGWNVYNSMYTTDNGTEDYIMMTDEFYDHVLIGPRDTCRPEYCKALGFTGNMDLTGIGVFVAYYVEAILATIYLSAFTFWYIHRQRKANKKKRYSLDEYQVPPDLTSTKGGGLRLGRRVMEAFRGSLNVFLNASMVFSLVMLCAALYISATRASEGKKWVNTIQPIPSGSAFYDLVLSLLASTFSVFPVTMLYAIQRRRDERGQLRTRNHEVWIHRVVLVLIWILAISEVYLSPRGEYDYSYRHSRDVEDQMFVDNCDQRGGIPYWQGMTAAQVLVVGAPLVWLAFTLFILTGFRIPGLVDKPWVSRCRGAWRLVVAWVNMLLMWGLLGFFTALRHRINATAGHIDQEDEWNFGQIMALASWAPVVVEFGYIAIWGIKEGLERNLPRGFTVKHASTGFSSFGEAASGSNDKAKDPLMIIRNFPAPSPSLTTPEDSNLELTHPLRAQTYPPPTETPNQTYTAYEPRYYQIPEMHHQSHQQDGWDQWNRSGW
ncbi:hypothetical protein VM1G_10263 [Cytospora mali]|uniref:Uncharacterized protein n=1 Tax=Cytospora mali TaxID=578113 RepID=A0A194VHG2_CYTMA|nr:hypothetical protein VM1G_10263 [Valsa mali]